MKLDDALAGVNRLGVDTSPIIYFVEAHPGYDPLVTAIFKRIDDAAILCDYADRGARPPAPSRERRLAARIP